MNEYHLHHHYYHHHHHHNHHHHHHHHHLLLLLLLLTPRVARHALKGRSSVLLGRVNEHGCFQVVEKLVQRKQRPFSVLCVSLGTEYRISTIQRLPI